MAWLYLLVAFASAIAGFMTAPILDALWRASQETAQTIEQTSPQLAQLFTLMMYTMIFTAMATMFSSFIGLIEKI